MSLDVYLREASVMKPQSGTGIFIRESGSVREISREEWDSKFPGMEPLTVPASDEDDHCVFSRNITHNLNRMADIAGVYQALWRPEEIGISKARQLVEPLQTGLAALKADPAKFEEFNPSSGWGSYSGLVEFIESYLKACEEYPDADVSVSR